MNFVLVALTISALTGEPLKMARVDSYPGPEACMQAQMQKGIEHVMDGKVTVYGCIREDQLGERST